MLTIVCASHVTELERLSNLSNAPCSVACSCTHGQRAADLGLLPAAAVTACSMRLGISGKRMSNTLGRTGTDNLQTLMSTWMTFNETGKTPGSLSKWF